MTRPTPKVMHYESVPCFRRVRAQEAPTPLGYAAQGFAPLRRRRLVTAVFSVRRDPLSTFHAMVALDCLL
jgi:hypothetical protein